MKKIRLIAMLLVVTLLFCSCGFGSSANSVSLNKNVLNLEVGNSETLVATVVGSSKAVWSTSSASVATVTQSGVVTAVAEGTATITVTAGRATDTCTVTVSKKVQDSVSLNKNVLNLEVGSSETLLAAVVGGSKAVWSTSSASIATVNQSGVVTAVAEGIATITVTAGRVTDTCTVTVSKNVQPVQDSVSLNKTSLNLEVGSSETLVATVVGGSKAVWSTSSASIATVNQSGVVTAVAEGIATITVTAGKATDTCSVIVTEPQLQIPVFFDYEIVFNAYASVPYNLMNDEQFANLSAAGFRKATGLYEGRVGLSSGMTESQLDAILSQLNQNVSIGANKALSLSEKYGIKYYVFNELVYNVERYTTNYDKYFKAMLSNCDYATSSAFAGHFFADEPSLEEMKELVSAVNEYKKYMPNVEPFINLLPCESKSSRSSYKKYLDYYFENLAETLGYVSFDHYPFGPNEQGINEMHLWNLEEVCQRAKSKNIEVRGFVWSNLTANEYHRGITSEADLRLQIYTNLAFGVDEMAYFVYSSNGDANTKTNALINYKTGKKSTAYTWAKNVNNEVLAFEDIYGAYAWQGVMTFGSNDQFSALTRTLASNDRIKNVNAESDVLMGVFVDKNGNYEYGAKDGFLVVNYADPYTVKTTSTVTIEFDDCARVMVCRNGQITTIDVENGKIELETSAGDGVFLVPLS